MNGCIHFPGEVYGTLTLVRRDHGRKWICRCSACGSEKSIFLSNLVRRPNGSCGCLRRKKIGDSHATVARDYPREYRIWSLMKDRCTNQKSPAFSRYGGRGIIVCGRWMELFANFITDMGPSGGFDFSLDRINNDGNYEQTNCRWATRSEQAFNRAKRMATMFGETKSIREWSTDQRCAVSWSAFYKRIGSGMPIATAFCAPDLRFREPLHA